MQYHPITALSPIDGRYAAQVRELSNYFSEFALIRYRVFVEVEYFIALSEIPLPQLANINEIEKLALRKISNKFSIEDALRIKEIERTTNHDVKAVEYFIKEKIAGTSLEKSGEFIHFGLTSQDINNTSVPLSLLEGIRDVYLPKLSSVLNRLTEMTKEWSDIPMLARTHGQPASPTRVGKEINVFVTRLKEQIELLDLTKFSAKFGGATGNFNAHHIAYPEIDWNLFAENFVSGKLGLYRSYPTTQIDHYDHLAALFHNLSRINTILIDLCKDIWSYISMEYFRQRVKEGEVGSSAMPHKVNPIDFENAEGNLGIANAIFTHLAEKLPVSRLQRDLTDSTVLRNVGTPIAHTIISLNSIEKGLSKLILDRGAIDADLESNWAVVAEGIQTILRREGFPKPYEALKALTRTGRPIDSKAIKEFIEELNIEERVKEELRKITPFTYTGI
ncbi:MAG: adenylosuccinate lyase [Bacteroidales bacterium]|jgi:adenylosuccinate lyase|nr:adenylosuccinate lyase [Bacteroidales bacterium]